MNKELFEAIIDNYDNLVLDGSWFWQNQEPKLLSIEQNERS